MSGVSLLLCCVQVRGKLPGAGDDAGAGELLAAAAAGAHRAEDPGPLAAAGHRDAGVRGSQADHLPLLLAVPLHPALSYW